MKKILLVILVLGSMGAFVLYLRRNSDESMSPPAHPSQTTQQAPTSAPTTYKDGSYTGSAVSMAYGTVQVQAVVSGGKLTDIQFLQMPNLPGHTSEVTNSAEPLLRQEAISAQNSSIDMVSGATQDTQAFQQSLDSALALAK